MLQLRVVTCSDVQSCLGMMNMNKAGSNGWIPLRIASLGCYIAVLKCLVHCTALLDVKDSDGRLPIDVALDEDVRQAFNDEEKRRRDHGFKRAVLTDGL